MTDLLEEFQRQQEERKRGLQVKVAQTQDHDPERAARIWGVSAATGLPNELVDQDLDNLESRLKQNNFSFEEYTDEETGSPIFNELATEDPYNYAVLNRDRLHMTAIERSIHSIELGARSGWGTIEMAAIADREIKGTSLPGDEALSKRLGSLLEGGDFGADNKFMKTLVYSAQQLPIQGWLVGQSVDEIALGGIMGGAIGLAGGFGIGAVPGTLGGMSAGFLTGRTEAAFRLERGLAYSEFRELGFDPDDALLFANGVGGINAALEATGLGALTKRIPGFRAFQKDVVGDTIANIFMKPTMRQAITRMTLQYGEGLATEVLTEVMQESTLYVAREHMKDVARDAGDTRPEMTAATPGEFWNMVKDTAVHTLYGTALIGAAGPLMNYRQDAQRARKASEQAAAWASLGDHAQASETQKTAKSGWTAFVERIQEKGPLKEIRFDTDGWKEYWQSKNIDPAEVAKEMGFDMETMEVTDVDIVIEFDTYLEKLAHTEHHAGLINDFRARPDEMTLRESEQWFKDSDQKIKEFEERLKEEHGLDVSAEIEQDLTGQLVAAGATPEAAQKQARLTAAIFTTMAARANKDPVQLYRERLKGVQRDIPGPLTAAGENVDMDLDPILDRIRNKDFPTQRQIYGTSLFDLVRQSGGIQDDGGEMSGRDVGKQYPGMIAKAGKSIDAMAEIAFEQGFIAEYDSDLFMEAFDRELGGDQVFGREATVNYQLEQLLGQLEAAAHFLNEEQIDLTEMTNQQVRDYLKGVKTLEQSSTDDLKDWNDLVFTIAMRQELMSDDVEAYRTTGLTERDSLLARAAATMPHVAEKQDFQDVKFTDKFEDSSGKIGTHTYSAQKAYDKAIKRRNVMNRLMDCINA